VSDAQAPKQGNKMKKKWYSFWSDRRGQDLVEYALAAGMVAVAAVAAMPTLSTTVSNVFEKIGSIINSSVI
jgi:pilus assembly protein Flp/PilA